MKYILLSLFLFSIKVSAYPLTEIKLLSEDITSIYDGDTLTVQIPYIPDVFGKDLSIRISGIDTPEMKSTCVTKEERERERLLATKARDIVLNMVASGDRVTLMGLDRDKYFRLIAEVYIDGKSIGEELISLGLAVPYTGGTKISWCGL